MIVLDGQIKQTTQLAGQINPKSSLQGNVNAVAGGSAEYTAGDNIHIENRRISVLTADQVESDNTRPITSAAVATQVGNIEILLQTI